MLHPFTPSVTGHEGTTVVVALVLLMTLLTGSIFAAGLLLVPMGVGAALMVSSGQTEDIDSIL